MTLHIAVIKLIHSVYTIFLQDLEESQPLRRDSESSENPEHDCIDLEIHRYPEQMNMASPGTYDSSCWTLPFFTPALLSFYVSYRRNGGHSWVGAIWWFSDNRLAKRSCKRSNEAPLHSETQKGLCLGFYQSCPWCLVWVALCVFGWSSCWYLHLLWLFIFNLHILKCVFMFRHSCKYSWYWNDVDDGFEVWNLPWCFLARQGAVLLVFQSNSFRR